MRFFKNLFKKDHRFHVEDVEKAIKDHNTQKLKFYWENKTLYRGYPTSSWEYDANITARSISELYANEMIDTLVAASNGRDEFEQFKFYIDLGVKITDKGYLDDHSYYFMNYAVNADAEGPLYNKYMDYVYDQVKELSFGYIKAKAENNPKYLGKNFLNWVVSKPELDKLRDKLYTYTGSDELLPKEARDIFLF